MEKKSSSLSSIASAKQSDLFRKIIVMYEPATNCSFFIRIKY